MSKIIVVGAGHGGLVAAAGLAKAGHDVTVYEAKKTDELGYEWEDRFTFDLLTDIIGKRVEDFPAGSWCYRADSTFLSPDKQTHIDVRFDESNRQRIMWRKPLINMLIDYAVQSGVELMTEILVEAPIVADGKVCGIVVEGKEERADLVIDASGVYSVLRNALPAAWGMTVPRRGDVFYAHRAYYNRLAGFDTPDCPFEVYLVHEGEPGLSWLYTMEDEVDVLIGRIDPIDQEKVEEQLAIFRQSHPWLGERVMRGGQFAVIPVRRPMPCFIGPGYAAVGDAAYMTTPMNGMGIDLSLKAGKLLADTVNRLGVGVDALWEYNRQYFLQMGAAAAKNEGLKNALLSMPPEGVDWLYSHHVIESRDLAGGGTQMSMSALLKKFVNGMHCPKYFFAIIKGLIKGGKNAGLYRKAPKRYDQKAIAKWAAKIESNVLGVE